MVKQGQASHSGMASTKVEPASKGINPAYPAQLGTAWGNHTTDGRTVDGGQKPMISGPGLRAPMVGQTNHPAGSQGKR